MLAACLKPGETATRCGSPTILEINQNLLQQLESQANHYGNMGKEDCVVAEVQNFK